jgi:predicted metal-dependent peptidase
MVESYTPVQRAEGKIRLGIVRLASSYPFHAAVLERFRLLARPEVATMGVTVSGLSIPLYYNPEFVLAITVAELVGVLLHEVHHIVFGHILADPADYPDAWARTVAEEVSVNEFVTEPLPGNPITLELFPNLPPGQSTQQRYARLKRVHKRRQIMACAAVGLAQCGTVQGSDSGTVGVGPDQAAGLGPAGCTVDDHGIWAEARHDPGRSRQVIRDVVGEAILQSSRVLERLPEHMVLAIQSLGIGCVPGAGQFELQGFGRGRVDWRRQLRRYAGRALEERPVFNLPSRRFPELVGILPGRRRQPTRPRVMAVIDTSGSMTDDLLEQADAELAGLSRRSAVVVVECDAAVQRVYPYRKLGSFLGRGGTDFRPPLEPQFLQRHRPDLIIFFTDGDGPAPTIAPRIPVIWCLTPGGCTPATWGRAIQMNGVAEC